MKKFIIFVAVMGSLISIKIPAKSIEISVVEGSGVLLSRSFDLAPIGLKDFFARKNRAEILAERLESGETLKDSVNSVIPTFGDIISGIIEGREKLPVNATVEFSPDKEKIFEYTPHRDGSRADVEDIISQIISGLENGKIKIEIKTITVPAEITVDDLRASTVLRSEFFTLYKTSGRSRKSNIKLASQKISGTVLQNGELFSFNQKVGKRTEERGFLSAKIIEDGRFVDGVGGGVCQVSTTLYNSVLLADLEVNEASRHSLEVSYIEPSFDAMVSSYSDLKFTNNSGGDLYIRAVADGERLTVQIYGTKLDVTVTRKSEKVKSIPYGVKYIEDKTLTEGEQRIITTGENGLESKGYLCYVKNGELIECKQIRHDVYKPKNSLVAVRSTEASEINRTA